MTSTSIYGAISIFRGKNIMVITPTPSSNLTTTAQRRIPKEDCQKTSTYPGRLPSLSTSARGISLVWSRICAIVLRQFLNRCAGCNQTSHICSIVRKRNLCHGIPRFSAGQQSSYWTNLQGWYCRQRCTLQVGLVVSSFWRPLKVYRFVCAGIGAKKLML